MTDKKNLLDDKTYLDKLFWVIRKGGSIGEARHHNYFASGMSGIIEKTFDDKDEANNYAKRSRKQLSPGEKQYYRMGYSVVKRNMKHYTKK